MPIVDQRHLIAFGQQVRAARTLSGLTLKELGFKALGKDKAQGFLSKIESGSRQIAPLTAGKLITYLGLPRALLDPFLAADPNATDDITEEDRIAEDLLAAAPPTSPEISESLLIALAERYAHGSHGDVQSAFRGLEAALETAAAMERGQRLPQNTPDQVDAILAEVAGLNRDGKLEAGAMALARARLAARERIALEAAGLARLLHEAVGQARLMNRPAEAAGALEERLMLDAPVQHFDALRALWNEWYERGRDKGLAFDLEVAIALAHRSVAVAATADQRGAALNDLGNALAVLGGREPGTARLEAAVAAYAEALKEYTRDRVPLDWAMTQNNLGNALSTLGDREPGTARLEAAVAAYAEALKEYTRDRVPLDWAATQNNLGTALSTLGDREPGTARLEGAVAAYAEALKERTRDRVPLQWATTQFNLSFVELAFFDKTGEPDHLTTARAHVEAAREVFVAAGAGQYVGMADGQLAEIARREGDAR